MNVHGKGGKKRCPCAAPAAKIEKKQEKEAAATRLFLISVRQLAVDHLGDLLGEVLLLLPSHRAVRPAGTLLFYLNGRK